MSVGRLGQKKRCWTRAMEALILGWASSCSSAMICRRRRSGTRGRVAAKDISQITSMLQSGSPTSLSVTLSLWCLKKFWRDVFAAWAAAKAGRSAAVAAVIAPQNG